MYSAERRVEFGAEGLGLMPEIAKIKEADQLHAFRQAIKNAASVEELKSLVPQRD
jgi:hypothetical protein